MAQLQPPDQLVDRNCTSFCIVTVTRESRLPEQHICEAVKLWKAGFAVAGLYCKGLCACCGLSSKQVGQVNRFDPYELLT